MAGPTDDPDPGAPPADAAPPPAHAEADARAAEQGMAKSGQAAQAAVDAADAQAAAFAEQDVPPPPASAASAGDGDGDDGSAVNSQAGETVALANGLSGEAAPVIAEAGLAQVAAQARGLALLNAVNAQQNAYVTANAAVAAIVARILALAPQDKEERANG